MKNRQKKLLSLLIAAILCISNIICLAACVQTDTETDTGTNPICKTLKYGSARYVSSAWEDDMIRSTSRMKELLEYKDIPAWIDFWGYDVNHDWDWWQVQFPYFVERVI